MREYHCVDPKVGGSHGPTKQIPHYYDWLVTPYTSVLEHELSRWIEAESRWASSQVGFWWGYWTLDHILTLSAIIMESMSKLEDILLLYGFLQSFWYGASYSSWGGLNHIFTLSAIITESIFVWISYGQSEGDLEVIKSTIGVKKGYLLSPILFGGSYLCMNQWGVKWGWFRVDYEHHWSEEGMSPFLDAIWMRFQISKIEKC